MGKLSGAIVWFLLLSLILSLGAFPPLAQASPQGQIGPLNPAFEQKLQEIKAPVWQKEEKQSNFGYFPSPLDWSHLRGKRTLSSIQSSFPSSYDLRALGKMPPVRNQGSYGTCWTFATFGSLESVLLPSESWNFSEDNLVNTSGFDLNPYSGGGNYDMATAYLARWSGPVREDQDPYPTPGFVSFPPSKHVQEVLYLPPRSGPWDNDTIKSALMSYGGVYTAIYWSDSYYNPSKASYYYSGSSQPNHAVVIVGWNDDYPSSNFLSTPPGNGAFIVRNSWGSSWGEGGYFYVSYYDSQIGGSLAVFNNAEPTDNYTNIYQYDPLGWTASYGFGANMAWFANRFSAQGNETLKAVSFYTASLNSIFQVYYGTSLSSLQLISSGTISLPGYHTVNLGTQVALSQGQVFFIVVKLTTPGYPYPVPVEAPFSGYSSNASASSNQSFVSPDGVNWYDITQQYSNTNVCLKAFTSSQSSPPTTPVLSVSPESLDFGTELTQLSFTVRNDGGSTLLWSASENIPWVVSLSSASGSLGVGETQSVTVTVERQGLSPGNYTGSISLSSNGGNKMVEVKMAVPIPDAVTITNLPATVESLEHQPLSFQVQANDSLGHPLTFTILSGPGTINSGTGQFTWSDPTPVGEYTVRIRAFCSQGASDEEELTIRVNPPPPSFSPSVQTLSAVDIQEDRATLNGSANPQGWPTEVWFEWGTTTSYGNSTPTQNLGSGTSTVPFSFSLGTLTPSTTYHFRAVARNQHGTSYGSDQAFTTLPPDSVSILNLPQTIETVKGHTVSFQVQASDSRGHSITFSLVSGPGTINSGTGQFNWSDPTPVGEYQSKIRATCSGGKWDEKILTIKVRGETLAFTYSLNSGWNMISLPLVTSPSPSAVFGGLPSGWRIFSWDPTLPGYRMNQDVTLEVGEGYWLKSPSSLEYTVEGTPFSGDLTIPLSVGWHMIGSPYLEEVSFSEVRILSG
ncbi:MAG: lectin like domain-containing protein, partial [bacterium]